MVQLNFNANAVKPNYGGDPGLPDGLYDVVIIKSAQVPVEKMGVQVGSYLELTLAVVNGPLNGQTMVDRLNLGHSNPKVVEIANEQLSAYCHVTGQYQVATSEQLHNRPFKIEVGRQINKETKQPTTYGEIKKLFDVHGNPPGKTGQGGPVASQPQPSGPPPAGVQADGGGWNGGGQPQGQPQGFGGGDPNAGQGGFAPPPQQGAGGFAPPAGDPNAGGGFAPPQGQPQGQPQGGGNWGAPAQPQGGAGGGAWSPQGGQQGGAPAWGAPAS